MLRHDLAVICKAALIVPDLLNRIQQQPWKPILRHVEGAELLFKILESKLQPNDPASIAVFFASIGMLLNPALLLKNWVLILTLGIVAILVRSVALSCESVNVCAME